MFGRIITLIGISTATLLLATGCGGSGDDPGVADPGGDEGNQIGLAGTPGATGSFSVTGDISMSGTLDHVLCMEANADNYVAQGTAHTSDGEVTVGAELPNPEPHEGDQQMGNSLKVGKTVYNRISMGSKPLSGHRDGEKLTVVAQLVNSEDPFDPDLIDHHDQWRTVTLTTHWDCAGALAKGDKMKEAIQGMS